MNGPVERLYPSKNRTRNRSAGRRAAGFSPRGAASRQRGRFILIIAGVAILRPAGALAQYQYQYERPVSAAPSDEDIGEGYVTPVVQLPLPRAQWREVTDVALLAAALGLGAWIVLRRRSRNWLVVLTIGCLLYFGLYREGCVCPIGAIQNVVVALIDPNYAVSYVVIAIFFLPLVAALLFGRVFCSGVCPLGAIQELVLLPPVGRRNRCGTGLQPVDSAGGGAGRYTVGWHGRVFAAMSSTAGTETGRYIPVRVPRLVDKLLGLLKWVYLALAIWFAARPAVGRDFIICRFDPFVGFFRLAGPTHMLLIGGGLLVLGMFVGRPYCRYLCPYGALLSLVSRVSWRSVSVTPDKELDCGLCAESCPYGAIDNLRAVRSSCLFCARCFHACPRHRVSGMVRKSQAGNVGSEGG